MGYSAETTHEGFPLPTGSDLTTPMDYNESLQKADTDIFNALANSNTALQKAIAVETGLADTNGEVTTVKGRVTTLEQTSQTQGTAITNLGNKVDGVKADALDMICAVDEGTAQIATVPVSEGDYFRYNDVLYMADDDIEVGDTIVPNTNCHATNVATELQNAGGGGSTVDEVARREIGTLTQLETTNKSSLVEAINEVLSQIGGNGMVLDFSTKQVLAAGKAITTQNEGLLVFNYFCTDNTSAIDCTVDGKSVRQSTFSPDSANLVTIEVPLKAGSVVLLSGTNTAAGRGAYFVERA